MYNFVSDSSHTLFLKDKYMDWVFFTLAVLSGAGFLYWYNIKLLSFACATTGGFFLMLLGAITMVKFQADAAGSLLFFVGGITWIIMYVKFLLEFLLWKEARAKQKLNQ